MSSGLALAGLSIRAGETAGFRAEVAVVYGPVPSGTGAPELHALVELRLAPVGPPGRFLGVSAAALTEIGEGVTAAPAGGAGADVYADLIGRLVGDLAGNLTKRLWPAAVARDPTSLRAALVAPAPATRLAALDEVAAARLGALAPDVAALLEDADASIGARAVGVLAELGEPSVIPALVKASRGKAGHELYRLLDAAGQIGGRQARAFLDAVSSGHPDPEARARAGAALAALLRREAGPASLPKP